MYIMYSLVCCVGRMMGFVGGLGFSGLALVLTLVRLWFGWGLYLGLCWWFLCVILFCDAVFFFAALCRCATTPMTWTPWSASTHATRRAGPGPRGDKGKARTAG